MRQMNKPQSELETTLQYTFKDKTHLTKALTHPSYAAEQHDPTPHNQRLEFLGDAVLQLVTSDMLFKKHLKMKEGKLTKIRSALANEHALAEFARKINLGDHLLLGKGEEADCGRDKNSSLADAFEAILGAMYIDGGFNPPLALCRTLMAAKLNEPDKILAVENPKGKLQELTQELFRATPDYQIDSIEGPEHSPNFTVSVVVNKRRLSTAQAGSRKAAEKEAALSAISILKSEA